MKRTTPWPLEIRAVTHGRNMAGTRALLRVAGVAREDFDGGLAILHGNLAEHGCVVKAAGVDESILRFSPRRSSTSPRRRRST